MREDIPLFSVCTTGGLYPTTKISQEAYKNYEDAKEFCSDRSDNPVQINEYIWESDQYKYSILELMYNKIRFLYKGYSRCLKFLDRNLPPGYIRCSICLSDIG